jgi:pimeloyl-ACP methyl ester carboxylesterase
VPLLTRGGTTIDYTDDGKGPAVVLIHSSVSANRQWRALIDALKDAYRVLAINLFGYGQTTAWNGPAKQSLFAQARLVMTLCDEVKGPLHVVGHSFGGAVALKSAAMLGRRVGSLFLFEPNPINLLEQAGRRDAFLELRGLGGFVQQTAARGDWRAVAERFADYWLGDNAWREMPEKRQAAFIKSLPPLLHEFDAILSEQTTVVEWRALTGRTMVASDTGTRRPIREIVEVFADACPHWTFRTISGGGHMAPLTHPELVNPIIREFLDASE